MQTTELLYDEPRWCLWLVDAPPEHLRDSTILRDRLRSVAASRRRSKTPAVQALAGTPALFAQRRQPAERCLALPEVSSVNRRIIPGAFLDPDVIAGNKLIAFPGADLWHFGLLQAAHFTAWVGAVSGRLKNDYNVSPSLSYFSFPFPRPHRGPRAGGSPLPHSRSSTRGNTMPAAAWPLCTTPSPCLRASPRPTMTSTVQSAPATESLGKPPTARASPCCSVATLTWPACNSSSTSSFERGYRRSSHGHGGRQREVRRP